MSKLPGHTEKTSPSSASRGSDAFFENLPEYLTPDEVALHLRRSRETVYAWKKKPERYGTPKRLFHKFGRRLYLRRDVLRQWFRERNKTHEPPT